jgi:ATP-dependent helicase/nuclease subunit B
VPGDATSDDPFVGALVDALDHAQRGDPLCPVTIVAPTSYAALATRRALGAVRRPDGRGGVANVSCTTPDKLLRQLGAPVLAARGLRVAPGPVDLAVIRAQAEESGGWLADLVGHGRALFALRDALAELRRCPEPTIAALAARPGRIGALAGQVGRVRTRLHEHGYAEALDVAEAAGEAARSGTVRTALGAVMRLDLGDVAPTTQAVLDLVCGAPPRPRPGLDGGVGSVFTDVVACADPDEEVRSALRAVLRAVDRDAPLWSQAIFHPRGPRYGRLVHQQLAGAGVASNGPQLRRLDRSTAGAALLGLLELAGTDWGRDDVMTWLSAAPILSGRDGRVVPATSWDVVSAEAGVVRGAAQWGSRLAQLAGRDGGRVAQTGELASFIDNLVTAATPPRGTWSSHVAWATGLLERYVGDGETRWPAAEIAAAEQVRGSLLALGELDAVSPKPDPATFLQTVRAVLEETTLDTSELPDGGFGDGVFVAPFGYARGLRFDTSILLGLADAVVPGTPGDDALLPEEVRRLDTSGGLRVRAARLEALHDDVRAALSAGCTRRVATFPRVDPRTGREHVASRWLDPLCRAGTRRRVVPSFAAGVRSADPPISRRELELHDSTRWVARGGDPGRSPLARASAPLRTGIGAARDRSSASFTRFDGNVGARLVSPFLADTPMSATRLETYAKCPRRFLFERVLGVSRRILPEELWQMEPTDRGTLVHAILEQYVEERLDGTARSLARLLAIADDHFAAAESGGLVGRALLWRMDQAAIRRDLARFYEEEGDLEPLAAELEFGTGEEGADPPVPVTLDDHHVVHFKGKADRVDRTPAGELVVSDYKTGAQRMLGDLKRDPVAGGRLLQLPIYAMAARVRFPGDSPVRARYWLLSERRSAPCYSVTVTDAVQARFLDVLGLIATAVEAGAFPGAPTDRTGDRQFDSCRSCDFDTLCPTTRDRQWARKRADDALGVVNALVEAAVPEELDGIVVAGFTDAPDAGLPGAPGPACVDAPDVGLPDAPEAPA